MTDLDEPAGDGEIFVVVGSLDTSDFDLKVESYCVRAYRSRASAEDHARRAGEVSAQAQAYERPPGTDDDYLALVRAAFPTLGELDPEWRRGVEAATTYRVERVRLG